MLSPAVRRATIALAILAVVIALGATLANLVAYQRPVAYFDTDIYFQAGARPVSLDSLALPKPPTVPLVDRALGFDQGRIETAQLVACMIGWLALGAVVVLALRRPMARVAAGIVIASFALAPIRVGWVSAMISESLNDSLSALLIALVLALAITRRRAVRWAGTAAAIVIGVPWMFARDTNAVLAIVAVVAAVVATWPRLRARWRLGWPIALALAALAGSAVCVWSQRATATGPALPIESTWDPAMLPRVMFPTVNNVLLRVLPDPEARAFFVERGLPVAELEPFAVPVRSDLFVSATDRPASHAWIAAHGPATYVSWVARHPLTRVYELARDWHKELASLLLTYMPSGWQPSDARGWITNRFVVLVLLAAAPFALWRPRRDPRRLIALCLVASGVVGLAAAYYGDALELPRHCWGAGQQILFGIALALLVALDRWLGRRRGAAPPSRPSS